jgi:phage terminase small subunit
MAPMKLTRKQERFVEEYLIDLNATQAAIRAGYSAKTARVIGHENLTKPDIAAAFEKARAERAERTRLTGDKVVDELRKIGFASMGDYMKSTPEGDPYLDFSTLTPDQKAALAEVTVEDFVDGRGANARAVKRVKCKLHDKRAALVSLGRHFGIFDPNKREPVEEEVDIDDVRATILGRLARLAAAKRAEGGKPGDEPRTTTEVPTSVELVERETAAALPRAARNPRRHPADHRRIQLRRPISAIPRPVERQHGQGGMVQALSRERTAVEQCYVRVKAPAGTGAVQTFSNRHITVGLDGIVEMSEHDAAYLIPAGWIKLADGAAT